MDRSEENTTPVLDAKIGQAFTTSADRADDALAVLDARSTPSAVPFETVAERGGPSGRPGTQGRAVLRAATHWLRRLGGRARGHADDVVRLVPASERAAVVRAVQQTGEWTFDAARGVCWAAPTVHALFGVSVAATDGTNDETDHRPGGTTEQTDVPFDRWLDGVDPADHLPLQAALSRAERDGGLDVTVQTRGVEVAPRWLRVVGRRHPVPHRQPIIHGVITDVTATAQAHRATVTAEVQRRLGLTADYPVFSFTCSVDGLVTECGPAVQRFTGHPPEYFHGRPVGVIAGDSPDAPLLGAIARAALSDDPPTQANEVWLRNKFQTWRKTMVVCAPVITDQHAVSIQGVVWDITDRVRAQEQLNRLESAGESLETAASLDDRIDQTLRSLVGLDHGAWFVVDRITNDDRVVRHASQSLPDGWESQPPSLEAVRKIAGDLKGSTPCPVLHQVDTDDPLAAYGALAQRLGAEGASVTPLVSRIGIYGILFGSADDRPRVTTPAAAGTPAAALARRLTNALEADRFQYEASMLETRYQHVFESSPMPLFVLDVATPMRVIDVNPAAVRLYGRPLSTIRGMHPADFRAPEAKQDFPLASALVANIEQPIRYHTQHVVAEGRIADVSLTLFPGARGSTVRVGQVEDLTRGRAGVELHERLTDLDRTVAVNELAGDIGHEVSSQLNAVMYLARSVHQQALPYLPEDIGRSIADIEQQSTEAATTLHRLLQAVAPEAGTGTELDVTALVRTIVETRERSLLIRGIDVVQEAADRPVMVETVEALLQVGVLGLLEHVARSAGDGEHTTDRVVTIRTWADDRQAHLSLCCGTSADPLPARTVRALRGAGGTLDESPPPGTVHVRFPLASP